MREDGTTGAFDARQLFKKNMKMALGALYRAELAKELEELGLTSHRATRELRGKVTELSWFELDCIPESLIGELSGRHQEIEAWMKKHGVSGAKAAEKAALSPELDVAS